MTSAANNKKSAPYLSRTKVTPPQLPPQVMQRSQLLDQLCAYPATRKLTVLQAPAGYGKSTTMRQVMARYQELGFVTIWLNFDHRDNDITRFLAAFSLAVAPHTDELDETSYKQQRNEELAHRIIEGLTTMAHPTVIFFDNLEVIKNPAVAGLITRGIEALPDTCRIFIGSRTQPAIGMARLNTKGQLTHVDSDALRFSESETQFLLTQKQSARLTPKQIQQLYKSTDGWPAALKLATFALQGKTNADQVIANFSGTNAAVAAYLAEEVLASLPQNTQDFLLQSSIFEEMDVDICNRVLQRQDSLAILLDLHDRNLFINISDEQANLFRYHNLFRNFLQTQLQRRHPQQLATLHQAASQVYLDQGRHVPAIFHALKAGDTQLALTLLQEQADRLVGQGRIGLLTSLLGQVPMGLLDQHLHLKLIYALCMTYTRGPQQAYDLLKDMDNSDLPPEPKAYLLALRPMQLGMMDRIEEAHTQGLAALPVIHDDTPNPKTILSQSLTQTSIILGEHDAARSFCDQARRRPSSGSDLFNQVIAESAESSIDLMHGHLQQASHRIKLAMDLRAEPDNSQRNRRGITMASIQQAEILYEQDQRQAARSLLATNSALVQDVGPPDSLITAVVILSRIVDDDGDYDHALQLLIELENSGHRLQLPRVVASARLERSRLWLAHGDHQGAHEQLKLAQSTYDWDSAANLWFSANDTLTPSLVQLRLQIRSGQADKAVPEARRQLKAAERSHRARRALKLRILLAEALFASGDHNSARRTMSQAMEYSAKEGFVRTLLEEGPSLTPLFKDMGVSWPPVHQGQESTPTGEHSAASAQLSPQRVIAAMPEEDRLTNTEMKVLSVLALGLSNMAMAEKLFVSESTVRTHLRNINLKLHASNRTEAVSIARQMGLIS